jgi:hypothetical protein
MGCLLITKIVGKGIPEEGSRIVPTWRRLDASGEKRIPDELRVKEPFPGPRRRPQDFIARKLVRSSSDLFV